LRMRNGCSTLALTIAMIRSVSNSSQTTVMDLAGEVSRL
jgi:hypothetical protein